MGTQLPTHFNGPGSIIQRVAATSTGVFSASGPVLYPNAGSNTSTGGTQYMTVSIMPKFATSILIARFECNGTTSGNMFWNSGIFRDAEAVALSVSADYPVSSASYRRHVHSVQVVAGSTVAQTFKVRIGSGGASQLIYVNADSGGGAFQHPAMFEVLEVAA